MSEELKKAYASISSSLGVAIHELRLKASILERIQVALAHQVSDHEQRDAMYSIHPENLFDTIKNAIKEYQDYK